MSGCHNPLYIGVCTLLSRVSGCTHHKMNITFDTPSNILCLKSIDFLLNSLENWSKKQSFSIVKSLLTIQFSREFSCKNTCTPSVHPDTLWKWLQPLVFIGICTPWHPQTRKNVSHIVFLFINLRGHNIEATKFRGEVTDWKQSGLEYLQSVCNYPAFGNKMIV